MEPEDIEQVHQSIPVFPLIIGLIVIVLLVAAIWKVFAKAGQPGWAALVPIYNIITLLKVAGKPMWWLLLFLIPFANFIAMILVPIGVAKSFGKGAGFGLGLVFLPFIFYPLLGFGDAVYTPELKAPPMPMPV